ncbi:ACT domain-containing protein [Solitalea canadensis]|uniref:Formyltetrahydrofolate hydrolase n=1 Tax=Solitalea canadensis (strain ATCC 29591 / DSM 3403 / JCM 21819 / LMG 8368 / NBRC 15130 / NCIMB 12057 / USAM 9D) TaxID=929556 RepID=H8KNK1_SOLCM|nr:ACT domain-containing protein [Solitalea canadensis]AFD07999.1 formyltetrahydrofolate hydrolase [Solitalea canadensis DSM 3403]
MVSEKRLYTLTLSCPDRTGIVAAVTSFIANLGGWITDASQHGDFSDHHFFMRVQKLRPIKPVTILQDFWRSGG